MAAKIEGIKLTGELSTIPECCHAVPKKVESHASTKTELLYVDLAEPIPTTSMGHSYCVIIIVDDYSRFKVTKFLESKDCTTVALESNITDFITPAG